MQNLKRQKQLPFKLQFIIAIFYVFVISLTGCCLTQTTCNFNNEAKFNNIKGFSHETNEKIYKFLEETKNYQGRKVATFDMDGTVIGQVPYYLADESLYAYALSHPKRKPALIRKMTYESNTSKQYVADRVRYLAGLSPQELIKIGDVTFDKSYKNKFFPEIKDLIENLKNYEFEIWVVSASPEFVYQGFVAKALNIPVTNIIGIKSVVKEEITTNTIIPPVAQQDGKAFAIETIVKAKPLIAVGNSIDDFQMLSLSQGLSMVVNPDDKAKEKELNNLTLKDYAKKHGWLTVKANDVLDSNYPQTACKKFHIRINKTNKK